MTDVIIDSGVAAAESMVIHNDSAPTDSYYDKNQNQGNFVQYREKKVHLIYYSPKIEKYSREKNLKIQKESILITKTP